MTAEGDDFDSKENFYLNEMTQVASQRPKARNLKA